MRPVATPAHSSSRTIFAVSIFVFCGLLSSFRLIRTSPHPYDLRPDDISQRSDERFARLQTALPRSGVFGYVGDDGDSATSDYYLAQYALAPRVVEFSPNHALVIGNFRSTPKEIPGHLQLIEDFGDGVLLLSNKDAN